MAPALSRIARSNESVVPCGRCAVDTLRVVSGLPELYVAVVVEADGPNSMISLGMAVAGRPDLTFYTELWPISDECAEPLAVSGLDRAAAGVAGAQCRGGDGGSLPLGQLRLGP